MNAKIRIFAALEIDAQTKARVIGYMKRLSCRGLKAGWTKPENLHITLHFFGDVEARELEDISAGLRLAAHAHAPFALSLGGPGAFPGRRNPRILWVGVADGESRLAALAGKIGRHCPDLGKPRDKAFHAHLTLARLRHTPQDTGKLMQAMEELEIGAESFEAKEIALFKSTLTSQGPVYEVLERFPLNP